MSTTKRMVWFPATMVALMALVLLAGCDRRGGELPEPDRTVHILSTVSYEKISKGLVLQSTPLTSVRFLQKNGSLPGSLSGAAIFEGNRSADGSITWQGTAPTYDQLDQNAYFVAYHPSSVETTGAKVDWTIDGATDLLLSAPWDAGKFSAPRTGTGSGETPLTFDHVLARLEVVFKAESGADLTRLQTQYGKITGIRFAQAFPTATYTYATNAVTFGGTRTDMALRQSDCQTAFAPMAVPASTNAAVGAAGLFAPTTGVFTLLLTTEKIASISVPVQLSASGANKNFEAGLKHTVTMTFKADKAEVVVSGCSIVDWTANYTAGSDVNI